MRTVAANQPNRIQQSSECCVYCGKSYKMRKTLDRHMILCEVTYKSKNRRFVVEEDFEEYELPSQKMLYKMVVELTIKCNRLEEKLEDVSKWVSKKKKNINVLEWLKQNIVPEYEFNCIIDHIHVATDDIEYLLKNTFYDTMNEIFAKTISKYENLPITCFGQKANTFYIYRDSHWQELSNQEFIKFMNYVFSKIYKHMVQWYQTNKEEINSNEKTSIEYNKTISKLMAIDFKEDKCLSKAKSVIHAKLKRDLKNLVDCEVEF